MSIHADLLPILSENLGSLWVTRCQRSNHELHEGLYEILTTVRSGKNKLNDIIYTFINSSLSSGNYY